MPKYNRKKAIKIATLLESDTYTIAELCKQVGIAERTFYYWQSSNAEFAELLEKARDKRMEFFAAAAKKSLLKKIQGYTVQEKHTTYINSGNGPESKPKIKEQKIVDKHFQPDTAAVIFTLTNAEPERWKNKYNQELTGKDGKDLLEGLTDDELDARIRELENKLNKST